MNFKSNKLQGRSSGRLIFYFGVLWLLLLGNPQAKEKEIQRTRLTELAGHSVLNIYTIYNSPLGVFTFPKVTFQDQEGNYWIGANGSESLYRYDNSTQVWTVFQVGPQSAQKGLHYETGAIFPYSLNRMNQSKDGKIWFLSDKAGKTVVKGAAVSFYDGKNWGGLEVSSDSSYGRQIGLFKGNDGKLWFWNNDELKSYDGEKWSDPIVLSKNLRALRKNTSSERRGIFNPDYASIEEKGKFEIFDALQDRNGDIWLCTQDGVIQFDERKKAFKRFHHPYLDFAMMLYEDQAGRMWLSNHFTIEGYNKKGKPFTYYNLSEHHPTGRSPILNAIYQDKKGQVFFGVDDGLFVFNEPENKWKFFNLKEVDIEGDAYDSIPVEHIMEDKSGRIWLTTRAGIITLEK